MDMLDFLRNKYTNIVFLDTETKDIYFYINFKYRNIDYRICISDKEAPLERAIFIKCLYKPAKPILIPHLNNDGKFCLSEEQVFSSMTLEKHTCFIINQFIRLLDLSSEEKHTEFLKEFNFYWSSQQNLITDTNYRIFIPKNRNDVTEIFVNIEKNAKKQFGTVYFENELNDTNRPLGTMENAIFIPISNTKEIPIPYLGKDWEIKDFYGIVNNNYTNVISKKNRDFLKKITIKKDHCNIFFLFSLENSVSISFGCKLLFTNNSKKAFFDKLAEDFFSLKAIPTTIYSMEYDMKYLLERVGSTTQNINDNVLIIGVGSVGSYILDDLIRLGITKFTLVDTDFQETGNTLRSKLPIKFSGKKKSEAYKEYYEDIYPQVRITSITDDLLIKTKNKDFYDSFTWIVVAIGSSDKQKKFNLMFHELKIQPLVSFSWLSEAGIACHLLLVDYSKKGCFNCLFYDESGKLGNNQKNIINDNLKLISNGCFGSFSPYGSNVLLRNTDMFTKVYQYYHINPPPLNMIFTILNKNDSLEESINTNVVIESFFNSKFCPICKDL